MASFIMEHCIMEFHNALLQVIYTVDHKVRTWNNSIDVYMEWSHLVFHDAPVQFTIYFNPQCSSFVILGLICVIVGVIIVIMDLRAYEALATFFGVDILQDYDEVLEGKFIRNY